MVALKRSLSLFLALLITLSCMVVVGAQEIVLTKIAEIVPADSAKVYLSVTSDKYIFTASGTSKKACNTLSVFDKETHEFITSTQLKQYTSTVLRIEAMHVKENYLYVAFNQGTSGGDPCIVKYNVKDVSDGIEVAAKTGMRPVGITYIDDDYMCRTDSGYQNITFMNTESLVTTAAIGISSENESVLKAYSSLYLHGNLLFATGGNSIYIYDATKQKNNVSGHDTQLLKSVVCPSETATVNAVRAYGDYLYAATTEGVYVIKVTDSATFENLGKLSETQKTTALEINNANLYVSSGTDFIIYSLADGASPALLHSESLISANKIHIRPGKIYLSTSSGCMEYSISGIETEETFTAPEEEVKGEITFEGAVENTEGAKSICAEDGYLFVLCENNTKINVINAETLLSVGEVYSQNAEGYDKILNIETKDGYLYVTYEGYLRKYEIAKIESGIVSESVVPLLSDSAKTRSTHITYSDKYIFVALSDGERQYIANSAIAVFDKATKKYLTKIYIDSGNSNYDLPVREMHVSGDVLYVSWNNAKTSSDYAGGLTGVYNYSRYGDPLARYDISEVSEGATLKPSFVVYNKLADVNNMIHPYNRGGTSFEDEENKLLYQSVFSVDDAPYYRVYNIAESTPAKVKDYQNGSYDCVKFIVSGGCLYEVLQNNAGLTKANSITQQFNKVIAYDLSGEGTDLASLKKGEYITEIYGDKTINDLTADENYLYLATTNGVEIIDKTTLEKISSLCEGTAIKHIKYLGGKLYFSTSGKLSIYDAENLEKEPLEYVSDGTISSFSLNETEKEIYVAGYADTCFGEVLSYDESAITKTDAFKTDELYADNMSLGTSYILADNGTGTCYVYSASTKIKSGEITYDESSYNEKISFGAYFLTYSENVLSLNKISSGSKAQADLKVAEYQASALISDVVCSNGKIYISKADGVDVLTVSDDTFVCERELCADCEISAIEICGGNICIADKTNEKLLIIKETDYSVNAETALETEPCELATDSGRIFSLEADGTVSYYETDEAVVVTYNPEITTPASHVVNVRDEDRGFPYAEYEKRVYSSHTKIEANEDYVVTSGKSGICVYDKKLNLLYEETVASPNGIYLDDETLTVSGGGNITIYEVGTDALENAKIIHSSSGNVLLYKDGEDIWVYDESALSVSCYDESGELKATLSGFESGADKILAKDGYIYIITDAQIKLYSAESGTHLATIDSAMNYTSVVQDVEIDGDYLYVSCKSSTAASSYLRMCDLKAAKAGEEEAPAMTNCYSTFVTGNTGGTIASMERRGDFIIADATDSKQIQIVNIKDRTAPYREGYLKKTVSFSSTDMAVYEDDIYLISGSGIFSYKYHSVDINEIEFVSDGIPTNAPIGKETYAKVKIMNESGDAFSGVLILAAYEGNEKRDMISLTSEGILAENGGETVVETQSLEIEDFTDVTLKAMLFESMESIAPLCSSSVSFKPSAKDVTLYVDAKSTEETENGSEEYPFKTIESAKDAVRGINRNMQSDITVEIAGGRYEINEPIEFSYEDSGFNGYNVIYKAKEGETPIISGGRKIEGWEIFDEEKGIYVADANGINTRQLFADGKRAVRARSEGGLLNGSNDEDGIGLYCYNKELLSYKNISDLEFVFAEDWTSKRIGADAVYKIDSSGKILIAMNKPFWNYVSYSASDLLYYENALELLDKENEFYIDTKADLVYYKPEEGKNVNEMSIIAPTLETLVKVEGEGLYKKAHNLEFSGIKFTDTTWMAPTYDGGFHAQQSGRIYATHNKSQVIYFENSVSDAIAIKNAHDIVIDSCELKNLGGYALGITHAASEIYVKNNTISDVSAGGVSIGEINRDEVNPEDERKHVKNIVLENNYILDTAVEYYSSCAVTIGAVQNVEVSHNEIGNTPYSGIHIGWGWNRYPARNITGLKITNNYIHDVVNLLGDGGAIYTTGYTLADTDLNPNLISENFIERVNGSSLVAGAAIYLDTGSSGYLIKENVIDLIESNSIWVPKWSVGNANNLFTDNYTTTGYTSASNVQNTYVFPNAEWSGRSMEIFENAGVIN